MAIWALGRKIHRQGQRRHVQTALVLVLVLVLALLVWRRVLVRRRMAVLGNRALVLALALVLVLLVWRRMAVRGN